MMYSVRTLKDLVKLSNKYDDEGQFLKANEVDEKIKLIKQNIKTARSNELIEKILHLPNTEIKAHILAEARGCLSDNQWKENFERHDFDEMPEEKVLKGVDAWWSGGLSDFLKTINPESMGGFDPDHEHPV